MRGHRNLFAPSAIALALALAGCSSGATPATSGGATSAGSAGAAAASSAGAVTLTLATFNEFGYTDALLKEYQDKHPGITIKHDKKGKSDDAHTNIVTRLAAGGSGLADIEAVDGDWLPEIKQSADKFADLKGSDVSGRWLDWVEKQATTDDGKLIGYGTDIGPEATCYRKDLFQQAGFATDRESVKKLLDGDWNHYFEVGKQFKAKVPNAFWYDSAGAIVNARVQQLANPFSSTMPQEKVIPADQNTAVKNIYDTTLAASTTDKESAGLGQWGPDWMAAFNKPTFATMQCPSWMLQIIEGNAGGNTNWDVADTFPEGGGNWGGSYLTVPASGAHVKEATELAKWLSDPAQTARIFKDKGNFPSQPAAWKSTDVTGATYTFFNNAPTGTIFMNRANAVKTQPFKGANYATVNKALGEAVGRVDVDKKQSAADSWKQFASDVTNNIKS